MEHEDGDTEEIDADDVAEAVKHFEEDASDPGDGDEDEKEEEEGTHGDQEEEDDDEEEEEEEEKGFDGFRLRLWPSRQVRSRWLEHLQASDSVAEVALAFSSFADHARAFGALGPEVSAADLLHPAARGGLWSGFTKQTKRPSSGHGASSQSTSNNKSRSKNKMASSAAFGGRTGAREILSGGRPVRASRKHVSYAEE